MFFRGNFEPSSGGSVLPGLGCVQIIFMLNCFKDFVGKIWKKEQEEMNAKRNYLN